MRLSLETRSSCAITTTSQYASFSSGVIMRESLSCGIQSPTAVSMEAELVDVTNSRSPSRASGQPRHHTRRSPLGSGSCLADARKCSTSDQ